MDEREERVTAEPQAQPTRVERETTVIHTGDRGGGGGIIAAVVALVVLGAILFIVFGGGLERAADETEINVNVETPDIKLPDVDVDLPEAPAEPGSGNGG